MDAVLCFEDIPCEVGSRPWVVSQTQIEIDVIWRRWRQSQRYGVRPLGVVPIIGGNLNLDRKLFVCLTRVSQWSYLEVQFSVRQSDRHVFGKVDFVAADGYFERVGYGLGLNRLDLKLTAIDAGTTSLRLDVHEYRFFAQGDRLEPDGLRTGLHEFRFAELQHEARIVGCGDYGRDETGIVLVGCNDGRFVGVQLIGPSPIRHRIGFRWNA